MSEANRHAESKDPLELHIIGAPKGVSIKTVALLFAVRQTWRPRYIQAAAEIQPSFARPVRVTDPDPHRLYLSYLLTRDHRHRSGARHYLNLRVA
jgi:hypothetical protein